MTNGSRWFAFEEQEMGPVVDFVEALPARFRAAIITDVERLAEYGFKSPVSLKSHDRGRGRSPRLVLAR